jgi:hypothetical protein
MRVNNALSKLKLVGNLASYSHESQDAERIVTALRNAVQEVETRFKVRAKDRGASFDL